VFFFPVSKPIEKCNPSDSRLIPGYAPAVIIYSGLLLIYVCRHVVPVDLHSGIRFSVIEKWDEVIM